MITPYSPTKKNLTEPTERLKTKRLADLLVGGMVEQFNKDMRNLRKYEIDYKHHLKMTRDYKKEYKKASKKTGEFDISDSIAGIYKNLRSEVRHTTQLQFVDDFRLVDNILYFTTKPLYFFKGTIVGSPRRGMIHLAKKAPLGRFIVRFDLPTIIAKEEGLDLWVQVVNVDYRVDKVGGKNFSHPAIKNSKICYGNTTNKFLKMLHKKQEIVKAVGLVIDIFLSANDGRAYMGWQDWFDQRKTIKQCYKKGEAITSWNVYDEALITQEHNIYL